MRKIFVLAGVVSLTLCSMAARADTIVLNWGEQNGPISVWPTLLDAGTDTFSIPNGQVITGAIFSSTWGNSSYPDTGIMSVDVNGVQMGACLDESNVCWTGFSPTPFSYTYTAGDLASLSGGAADLTIDQTGPYTIRLGDSTLTITTTDASLPEPAPWWALGAGMLALTGLARRKQAIAAR